MLLQMQKTLGSLFALRTHTIICAAHKLLKQPPLSPSQPPLFFFLHPLPRARDSTFLVLSFFRSSSTCYAQHQSLSGSAISHLWFFLILIVIYHFFRLHRSGAGHSIN